MLKRRLPIQTNRYETFDRKLKSDKQNWWETIEWDSDIVYVEDYTVEWGQRNSHHEYIVDDEVLRSIATLAVSAL